MVYQGNEFIGNPIKPEPAGDDEIYLSDDEVNFEVEEDSEFELADPHDPDRFLHENILDDLDDDDDDDAEYDPDYDISFNDGYQSCSGSEAYEWTDDGESDPEEPGPPIGITIEPTNIEICDSLAITVEPTDIDLRESLVENHNEDDSDVRE